MKRYRYKPALKPDGQRPLFDEVQETTPPPTKALDALLEGRVARDRAIRRAEGHATRVDEDWSKRAYEFVEQYARKFETFSATTVRIEAERSGLPVPPDARAWGGAFQRAAKAGLIVAEGWEQNAMPHAHCRPTRVWRSRVCA